MSVYNLIKKRRSIRSFLKKEIPTSTIRKILDSARWAPSGLNNQPWRFVIIKNRLLKHRLASLTKYSHVIDKASCVICVFLDKKNSYNETKDIQAIGACIQNILLCSCEMKIYSCWLGEILNKKTKVNKLIELSSRYDLMAAIALGYSKKKAKSRRISLQSLILKELL